jgi:hypothetical protein
MPPERVVQHLTLLFRDPVPALKPFTAGQIAQGIEYLVSNSCSNYMYHVIEQVVPWNDRRECIRAIPRLFASFFAERCSEGLSHRGEATANPLNGICYMWWDVMPYWGRGNQPAYAEQDREFLGAMERILTLRSLACQESALHGLGHWHLYYPQNVEVIIDHFLEEHPRLRPELRLYAEHARTGSVQ